MRQKVIYPGTFDPVTKGHIDIIERAASVFPEVVVAIASSQVKKPYFSFQERIEMVEASVGHLLGVHVMGFDSLLTDFAKEQKASVILRGLRAASDFEYEFQLAGMNRKLDKDIETLFLTPSEEHMFISSSLVREIATMGGDITNFVTEPVLSAFSKQRRA